MKKHCSEPTYSGFLLDVSSGFLLDVLLNQYWDLHPKKRGHKWPWVRSHPDFPSWGKDGDYSVYIVRTHIHYYNLQYTYVQMFYFWCSIPNSDCQRISVFDVGFNKKVL